MSYIKTMLDDINEHFIANINRVELHWMEQEFERAKQEEHEKSIHELEVDYEVVPVQEGEEESSSALRGGRYIEPEIFNHQPIFKIRDARDV